MVYIISGSNNKIKVDDDEYFIKKIKTFDEKNSDILDNNDLRSRNKTSNFDNVINSIKNFTFSV